MNDHRTCLHPDREEPRMMCGYPIPCPFHTAIIHSNKTPVTVEIPIHSDILKSPARERVGDIARAIAPKKRKMKR
jgi:hypothetical protein